MPLRGKIAQSNNVHPSIYGYALCLLQFLQNTYIVKYNSPAMQAGLTKRVMSVEDIANLTTIETLKKRGSYKKSIPE